MRCVVCRNVISGLDGLEDINQKTHFSKKSVYGIITYLAKTARPPIDISWSDQSYEHHICKICMEDILVYDEYMVKLLEVQKRIVSCLRNPREFEEYVGIQALDDCVEATDEKVGKVEINIHQIGASDDGDNYNNAFHHEIEIKTEANEESELDESSKDVSDDNPGNDANVGSIQSVRKFNVPVKCNSCCKIFKNKSQLSRHMNIVHNASKKIWKCDICGAVTKDEEYLELHMNIHDGKSDLECRYCNKRYTRRINVIRHMQKHWDKKKFQCERCGLRFSERPLYYNHRLQHEAEEDPLICAVCNQSFKTRRTYRNHLWVHREDRPRYGCEFCGKQFVERYTLKVHLRCHSDKEGDLSGSRRKISNVPQHEEKKIVCIICGDQFFTNDSCDHHMKVEHDVILKAENVFV